MENGIAKEDLVSVAAENLGHGVTVDSRDDEHALVAENAPFFLGYLAHGPSLKGILQVHTIYHGRGPGRARHVLGLLVDVGAVPDLKVDVHCTQANGIHLPIELGDHFAGAPYIAVCPKPPDVHLLAEQKAAELIVAAGWAQTHAHDLFAHGRLPGFFACKRRANDCMTTCDYYTRFPPSVKVICLRMKP